MRVDAVVDAIHEALNEFAPSARLLAVGIGAPGIVDGLGRISVSRAIPEWDGIDLAGHLRQAFACPVFVENDAHAATLGEAYYGAGRGARTFAYLMAGYRISSGIVIGGKLHRGWSGASGMVGEMDILEWKTAPDALVARASAADANLGAALDVFSAAAGGDAAAQAAVDQYVDSLAVGLSALSLAIDPELIVVGGGTSMVGQPLADSLRERLSAHASIIHPRIEISTLEDQAVAMGGIRLAFDYVETSVFDLSAIARS
jgi:predicted NBD/HSP70 family sugar kinase